MSWVPYPGGGRIDAVIVDYGTPDLAERCFDSLRHSSAFDSVTVLDAKKLGWSYAQSVNTALRHGHGDIVLALNADTLMVEPPDQILALFDEDRTIGIVGPLQHDQHGRITHAGIVGTNTTPQHRFWQADIGAARPYCNERALDCVYVSGAVFFARRACWEQVGGFLETPMYYEETFACYKARHLGWRVVYTGETVWRHEWNSSPADAHLKAQMAVRSQEMFRDACQREGIACA